MSPSCLDRRSNNNVFTKFVTLQCLPVKLKSILVEVWWPLLRLHRIQRDFVPVPSKRAEEQPGTDLNVSEWVSTRCNTPHRPVPSGQTEEQPGSGK